MNDEIILLDKQINQMAEVFNALPGEAFRIKDAEALLIIQRRLRESDLLKSLSAFNEILAKSNGVGIEDLSQSAVAYIAVKILIENQVTDFDESMRRQLIKEYKDQIAKANNIIHLSKVNAVTADPYQKDAIRKTLVKNEAFLEAFQNEVVGLEEQIGKCPKGIVAPQVPKEECFQKNIVNKKINSKVHNLIFRIKGIILRKKIQKETDDKLRGEEKNAARTKCAEIPFYDSCLKVTEMFACKDIPEYSLLKRKNRIYFGLSANVKKGVYRNRDQSLLELTEATEDFIQYMGEDLLSGEYELKPFTDEEKQSLQMYFGFISACFEKNIGNTLTMQEYLQFKNYYNRLVAVMHELEERFRRNHYRALKLAADYIFYMECYDLAYNDNKNAIVENIMSEQGRGYVADLEWILQHHVVNEKAKDLLQDLIKEIRIFTDGEILDEKKPAQEKEASSAEGKRKINRMQEGKCNGDFFPAKTFNDMAAMSAEDLSYIQMKIQFQDEGHVIIDEALFSVSNLKKAVYDYLKRNAYIKKIGLHMNGKDVFLYSSKNSSLSVAVLTDEMKRIKQLDTGIQGQLVAFYEGQIKAAIVESSMLEEHIFENIGTEKSGGQYEKI